MAKERQFWKTLKAVVFFVACAVLGFALAQTSLMEMLIPSDGVSVWAAVAALFIAPVFVIFVHELGHLLVGLVQGFAFRLFVVGPFGWRQERDEGVHFFWNTNLSLMGGVAATVPKAERSDVELAFARTLLAGPVVSLLAALLSLVLAVYTQSSFDAFLGISALGNFAIFLATTLPEKSGAFFNDRKRWQRLRSDGPEQASELALLHAITTDSVDGTLKAADPAKLQALLADSDATMQIFGQFFLWKHYLAVGNEDAAATHLAQMKARRDEIPDSFWKLLEVDFEKDSASD